MTRIPTTTTKKRPAYFTHFYITVEAVPLVTIEILSPEQGMNSLINRIYKKHFPASVKTAWLVEPTLQTITLLHPDRSRDVFSAGIATHSVTGLQIDLWAVFAG